MNNLVIDIETLDRECVVFCRYLIGQEPGEYVKRKYQEGHRRSSMACDRRTDPAVDSFLVKFASISPWTTRLVDVHARVFRKSSLVRKKLILMLAILESCAPTHHYLDTVDSATITRLFLGSLYRCSTFVVMLLVAIVVIFPLQVGLRGSAKFRMVWLPRHG
jgi:hypothetical protein